MSHRHGLGFASCQTFGGMAVPVVRSGLASPNTSPGGRDYLAGWLLDEVALAAVATLWILVAFRRQGNSDATVRR